MSKSWDELCCCKLFNPSRRFRFKWDTQRLRNQSWFIFLRRKLRFRQSVSFFKSKKSSTEAWWQGEDKLTYRRLLMNAKIIWKKKSHERRLEKNYTFFFLAEFSSSRFTVDIICIRKDSTDCFPHSDPLRSNSRLPRSSILFRRSSKFKAPWTGRSWGFFGLTNDKLSQWCAQPKFLKEIRCEQQTRSFLRFVLFECL